MATATIRKRVRTMTTVFTLVDWTFDYHNFGFMCRQRREAAHISQNDIAELIGVSHTQVSMIERGKCRTLKIDTMLALANLYDLNAQNYLYLRDK